MIILVALFVAQRFGTAFPYGTFLINVSGSLVIGFHVPLTGFAAGGRPEERSAR